MYTLTFLPELVEDGFLVGVGWEGRARWRHQVIVRVTVEVA